MDLDGFKGMSPGNELDKCIGDLRKKVTEDPEDLLKVTTCVIRHCMICLMACGD